VAVQVDACFGSLFSQLILPTTPTPRNQPYVSPDMGASVD
jgi:hypothetical protein